MQLHSTQHIYIKIVEVEHTLKPQDAVSGSARGETYVISGLPQIHDVVFHLLKIDIVYRVTCGDNHIMVFVTEPHRWNEIDGLIQSVIAKHVT